MKRVFVLAVFFLSACMSATPLSPVTAALGEEITLAPGQSATIADSGLSLTLVSVPGDQRCPLEVECTETGPVTVAISAQKDGTEPVEFTLQTFTDTDGRAPEGPFEGIRDRVEVGGYKIRVKAVLPHPLNFDDLIEPDEYRVSFVIEEK